MNKNFDAVIIGAGHNGLITACYLAQAGKKVLMLEKNDYIGGATTSQQVFPDFDAKLSRYSYLVSLLPNQVIAELGLNLNLLRRNVASYTPYGADKGLIISNINQAISKKSILDLGYGEAEWLGYQHILDKQTQFAELVWDSFLQPLRSKNDWKNSLKNDDEKSLWKAFVDEPIGHFIDAHIKSDVLRGVMLTDAKIGSFTEAYDESLLQNKTFIYHVVGNKTGEWRVPQGGMGNLASQLTQKALNLGVQIELNAKVKDTHTSANKQTVFYEQNGQEFEVKAEYLIWNANPKPTQHFDRLQEGTAFKINMLLKKLPSLKNKSVNPTDAFAGTFHINQLASEMQTTYNQAISNQIPARLAGEIYCHTLTDPSILSPQLQAEGYHTLTYFGLDLPYNLFISDNDGQKKIVMQRFFEGINEHLDEPLQSCLAVDKAGNLCIEGKSSLDLEKELALPRGNIFHSELSWFFAENEDEVGTFGVETEHPKVFVCGSSAKRGGAVSGVPARNLVRVLLEE
jgi:phytoene dehydrogenase-like protein